MLAKEIVMLDDNWSISCSTTMRWWHSLSSEDVYCHSSLLDSMFHPKRGHALAPPSLDQPWGWSSPVWAAPGPSLRGSHCSRAREARFLLAGARFLSFLCPVRMRISIACFSLRGCLKAMLELSWEDLKLIPQKVHKKGPLKEYRLIHKLAAHVISF